MTPTTTPQFNSLADIRRYLADTTDYEKMVRWRMKRGAFDLGRVERFLDALDAPQTAYECIHIAGTNGKGSTTHAIDALLREHGYPTGRYTSPHLERETERIAIDGNEITEAALVSAFREMAPVLARFQPSGDALTWFEIMTGAALVAFRAANVEFAVLETGLGGRLDATNAVMPAVTVITSIGHDHHDKLGPTLADIAYEKAGIIKPGVPLITGSYDREGLDVVLARARALDAPVHRLNSDFEIRHPSPTPDGMTFALTGKGYKHSKLTMPGLGLIQATNAALAVEALHALVHTGAIEEVRDHAVRSALAKLHVPGRCEVFSHAGRTVLLDVAHTPEAMHQTVKTVRARFANKRRVLVMALAKDKEGEAIMGELAAAGSNGANAAPARPAFDAVVFTEFESVRARTCSELAGLWGKYGGLQPEQVKDSRAAFERGLELAGDGGVVVVTGSFYLAGALRAQLTGK